MNVYGFYISRLITQSIVLEWHVKNLNSKTVIDCRNICVCCEYLLENFRVEFEMFIPISLHLSSVHVACSSIISCEFDVPRNLVKDYVQYFACDVLWFVRCEFFQSEVTVFLFLSGLKCVVRTSVFVW